MIAANQRPRNVGLRAMRMLSASITREISGKTLPCVAMLPQLNAICSEHE
jgi:hypothetical protein